MTYKCPMCRTPFKDGFRIKARSDFFEGMQICRTREEADINIKYMLSTWAIECVLIQIKTGKIIRVFQNDK